MTQLHHSLQLLLRRCHLETETSPSNHEKWQQFLRLLNQHFHDSEEAYRQAQTAREISAFELQQLHEQLEMVRQQQSKSPELDPQLLMMSLLSINQDVQDETVDEQCEETLLLGSLFDDAVLTFAEAALQKRIKIVTKVDEALRVPFYGKSALFKSLLVALMELGIKKATASSLFLHASLAQGGDGVRVPLNINLSWLPKHGLSGPGASDNTPPVIIYMTEIAAIRDLVQEVQADVNVYQDQQNIISLSVSLLMRPETQINYQLLQPIPQSQEPSIVIVENNPTNRALLKQNLKNHEQCSIVAFSSDDFVEQLIQTQLSLTAQDVLFFDVRSVVEHRQSAEALSILHECKVKLIGLLDRSFQSQNTPLPEINFHGTLNKPIDKRALHKLLDKLADPASSQPTEDEPTQIIVSESTVDSLQGKSVLLADSEQLTHAIACAYLKALELTVTEVKEINELKELLCHQNYDAVILGHCFLTSSAIKLIPNDLPILALVSQECHIDPQLQSILESVSEVLELPIKKDQLQQKVVSCVKGACSLAQPCVVLSVHDGLVDEKILAELQLLSDADTPDILGLMLSHYYSDTDESIGALQQAYQHQDIKQLHFHAHSLKSSSASIGATKMTELCKQLEMASRQGKLDIEPQIKEISECYSQTKQKLQSKYAVS